MNADNDTGTFNVLLGERTVGLKFQDLIYLKYSILNTVAKKFFISFQFIILNIFFCFLNNTTENFRL